MWSSLTDGTTIAFGENCAPAFVAGIVQSLDAVMLPADAVPVEMGGTLVTEVDDPSVKPTRKRRERPPHVPEDAFADADTDPAPLTAQAPVQTTPEAVTSAS